MRVKFRLAFDDYESPIPDTLVEEITYFQYDVYDQCIYMKSFDGTKYKTITNVDFEGYDAMANDLLNNSVLNMADFTKIIFKLYEDEDDEDDDPSCIND